jgi:YD repeat-containing protein
VCTRYDSADAEASTVRDSLGRGLRPVGSYAGRVASVTDKAQKTVLAYDGRGRVTGRLKRVALVDPTNPSQPRGLAPRAYLQEIAYDEANRVVSETTGVTSTGLQGAGGTSTVTSVWDKRGAVAAVTSSYGDLVSKVTRDAQGRVTEIVYADAAKTTTQMVYDARGRLVNTQTFRTKPSWWTSGGTGAPASYKAPGTSELVSQAILESRSVTYDEADNPVLIADGRTASEWPAGAKPVTKRIRYDNAYRVTRVEYLNPSGATVTAGTPTADTWVDPFDAEDRATPLVTSASTATANPKPAPHAKLPARVKREDYAYDSLGNILTSSDDANAFYDRSLGAQTHGTSVAGPYQLKSASNRTTASASLYKGALEAQYDAAGNLTAMVVQRDTAAANCLPSGASCWQRYAYAWDEVGRLMTASRWDLKTSTTASANERTNSGVLAKPAPTRTPDARMAYLYDGAGEVLSGATRHIGQHLRNPRCDRRILAPQRAIRRPRTKARGFVVDAVVEDVDALRDSDDRLEVCE